MSKASSHSNNKAFQGFLETSPLLWNNVFAIQTLNQNNDSHLNIVDVEAIPANIVSLRNDSEPFTTLEHSQPAVGSRDLFLNSSLTSSALRKFLRESATATASEHAQTQYVTRKRKVTSSNVTLDNSSKLRKHNRESVEDINQLLDTITPMEERDSNFDEDFFSDIFDDLSQAQCEESNQSTTETEAELCSPTSFKKPRLMKSSNLTRSHESFRNLSNMDLSVITTSSKASLADLSPPSIIEPISTEEKIARSSTLTRSLESFSNLSNMDLSLVTLSSKASSTDSSLSNIIKEPISMELEVPKISISTSPSVTVSDNSSQEATNIIDGILNIDTTFPNIPASISMSSCSSVGNLSQTSMLDAQGSVEESKSNMNDIFGWFVEMDQEENLKNRVDANCDLTYSVATAPTSVSDDGEIEYAKAADTVDYALANFF